MLLQHLKYISLQYHHRANLVDEAGMKKWSNDMLKGHPGGWSSTWEQWGNSFTLQFKGAMDTMSHSLRIKEDSIDNVNQTALSSSTQ